MTNTAMKGTPVQLSGDLPAVGQQAPQFTLVGTDLADVTSQQFQGRRLVLNIFPSVDTGVCATSVRRFNELASGLDNTTVVCVSKDLPMAQGRFCGAEGLDDVVMGSDFRGGFDQAYGVLQADGPLKGLLARAVVVVDADGSVLHSQLVDEITTEPDYDAAVAALS